MARRPCIEHGCTAYVEAKGISRCPKHQQEWAAKRWNLGLTGQRGSRPGWRKLRERVLIEQGRRCAKCFRRRATVVHHINHDAKDDRRENLEGLCATCHKEEHK